MTTEHPITPPEDKFKRWEDDILNERENVDVVLDCAWKDGYRAGADAELEACVNYVDNAISGNKARALRTARRPKPPSLAEEALVACERSAFGIPGDRDTIRRALERLQELEKGNE